MSDQPTDAAAPEPAAPAAEQPKVEDKAPAPEQAKADQPKADKPQPGLRARALAALANSGLGRRIGNELIKRYGGGVNFDLNSVKGDLITAQEAQRGLDLYSQYREGGATPAVQSASRDLMRDMANRVGDNNLDSPQIQQMRNQATSLLNGGSSQGAGAFQGSSLSNNAMPAGAVGGPGGAPVQNQNQNQQNQQSPEPTGALARLQHQNATGSIKPMFCSTNLLFIKQTSCLR